MRSPGFNQPGQPSTPLASGTGSIAAARDGHANRHTNGTQAHQHPDETGHFTRLTNGLSVDTCPWPCLAAHVELKDPAGRPRATACNLCGQLVSRAEWLATLAPEGGTP